MIQTGASKTSHKYVLIMFVCASHFTGLAAWLLDHPMSGELAMINSLLFQAFLQLGSLTFQIIS